MIIINLKIILVQQNRKNLISSLIVLVREVFIVFLDVEHVILRKGKLVCIFVEPTGASTARVKLSTWLEPMVINVPLPSVSIRILVKVLEISYVHATDLASVSTAI